MRVFAVLCAALVGSGVYAEEQTLYLDNQPIGQVSSNEQSLNFNLDLNLRDATISVSGPNRFRAYQSGNLARRGINLSDFGTLPDGVYQFEVATIGKEMAELASPPLNNGRDGKERKILFFNPVVAGSFSVSGGRIMMLSGGIDDGSEKDEK